MTKKEFYDLCDQIKENHGFPLSEDDIYVIGEAHKTLPQHEKDWQEVVDITGWARSAEALRSYIARRQRHDGKLPPNPALLSNRNIEEASTEMLSENLDAQLSKLYIEKTKVRDTYNAYRRTLRDEARIESFKDTITSMVSQLNELPKLNTSTPISSGDTEAILMLSDLHIGVDCDNFYNKYNTKVAAARLDILANEVIKYCELHKVCRLSICDLGDSIAGLIHINARLEQELTTVEQVMTAAELLAQFLNKVQYAASEVYYRTVTDNHSRIVADKNQHIEKDNLGKIIVWYLTARLEGSRIKFKHDNIDDSLGKFDLLNKKTVIFAHGHLDTIDRSFQSFVGATREFVDYVLLGHYHSEKMKSFQGTKVYVNGSIVGTEQYALSKRLFSDPSQTLLIFNTDNDNVINISIDLK